jgi:hypothetical protein
MVKKWLTISVATLLFCLRIEFVIWFITFAGNDFCFDVGGIYTFLSFQNIQSMIAYFGNPHGSLHQFIPQFDYLLFSLNEIYDYQIDNFKNDLLSMTAMLMKHRRDDADNFQRLQPFLVKKLNALDANHQDDFIKTTFKYIEGVSA